MGPVTGCGTGLAVHYWVQKGVKRARKGVRYAFTLLVRKCRNRRPGTGVCPPVKRVSASETGGWSDGGLCATWLSHRGFTEGYPRSIQSFHFNHREERNNSAQNLLPMLTGKRGLKAQGGLSSLLISELSPGSCSATPVGATLTPSVGGVQGMVYPGCIDQDIPGGV